MKNMFLKSVIVLVAAAGLAHYFYFQEPDADRESIKGKRVLITGASQSIGEELAYQYSRLGARLMITARREEELKRVAQKCEILGSPSAKYLVADMSNTTVYKSVIDETVDMLGGIDILVLNHVLNKPGRWEGSEKDFKLLETTIPVNYVSYVGLYSASVPHLKASKGHVLLVGSHAGRPGVPYVATYSASKSAVQTFFTSLQLEQMNENEVYPIITIAILGAVESPQAVAYREKTNAVFSDYPMQDTVSIMIDGTIKGKRYVYAPPSLRYVALMRELSPEFYDEKSLRALFH